MKHGVKKKYAVCYVAEEDGQCRMCESCLEGLRV